MRKVVENKNKKYSNNEYYQLKVHKDRINAETQKAVQIVKRFLNADKTKVETENYLWFTKSLIKVSEYSNYLYLSIPKSWKLEFKNNLNETIECDNIDEYCSQLGLINYKNSV